MSMSPPTEGHEPAGEPPEKQRWIRLAVIFGVVLALAFVGALVAIGNHPSSSNPPSPSSAALSTSPTNTSPAPGNEEANGDCTSNRSDADIHMTTYGGGEAACVAFDKGAAKAAEQFWQPTNEEPRGQPICSMEVGHLIFEVRQGEGESQGNAICARLLTQGGHEVEGPGEHDEREQKETEANQQAQAATTKRQTEEAERPVLESQAAKLHAEAAALTSKEHQQEGFAKHDEAEANRVEAEEPSEGGDGSKSGQASDIRGDASTHEGEASSFRGEAESKTSEAEAASKQAAED